MNAERLAELMKMGLIQRKKEVLADLGGRVQDADDRMMKVMYVLVCSRADEVEEIEALLRSDLVKRAREILEAAK